MEAIKNNRTINTSPEGLALLRYQWWPEGSGPITAMKTIINLIDLLAEAKGYDLDNVVFEINGTKYAGNPPRRI